MRLLAASPPLLLLLLLQEALFLPGLEAQQPRSLDTLLQDYAFRALVKPKTGTPYDARVPSNLTGIKISALRLRSGSLRVRGLREFKEFQIPKGVAVQPYVVRLVLVYHNLGNWSSVYYPLPGYSYLAPILGLLAFNGSDLSATDLPELDISPPSHDPILIHFRHATPAPEGPPAKCVYFDLNGAVEFDKLLPGNACRATQQGHFSVVVESNSPSPAPAPSGPVPPAATVGVGKKGVSKEAWVIIGSAAGGLVLLVLSGVLLVCFKRRSRMDKMQKMERVSEGEEALHVTFIGNMKVPSAMGTRTPPELENEYVP